jgi:hypothetical protein
MNYAGPSMNPTLKGGDGLRVIPYGDKEICIGDVVVFAHPEGEYNVAHRVVSIDSQGIRTRGDNNTNIDPWVLRRDDIIGRVVSAQRRDGSVAIHGGTWGRILAPALWTKKQLDRTVSKIFYPAYHALAKCGLIRQWLPLHRKTRILSFNKSQGKEFQLLFHNRVIGRRPPGKSQWHITRPFRLFIDESSLPQ